MPVLLRDCLKKNCIRISTVFTQNTYIFGYIWKTKYAFCIQVAEFLFGSSWQSMLMKSIFIHFRSTVPHLGWTFFFFFYQATNSRSGYHILTSHAECQSGNPMLMKIHWTKEILLPSSLQLGWYGECKSNNSINSASLHLHHELYWRQYKYFPLPT